MKQEINQTRFLNNVAEIELTYKSKVKASDRATINAPLMHLKSLWNFGIKIK